MDKAKEIVKAAGGIMQDNIAQVPLGDNLAIIDAVRADLEQAGYKVLGGNISFINQFQVLKIERR